MIATVLFASCASPSITTVYKNRDNHTSNIHTILVAGIIAVDDTTIRKMLETSFVLELNKAGYNAVSSFNAFGPKGLANLGQEATLMTLCNSGFDAVFTIALIDGSKEKYRQAPKTSAYAAGYYLDRIWRYENIQADISHSQRNKPQFWECILFDLYSLRPLGTLQTDLYDVNKAGTIEPGLAKLVIAKMRKEKIIRNRSVR